jgi:hypothetical protein
VQGFDCGIEPHATEVNRYIRQTLWTPGRTREQVLLAETEGGDLFGFGAWKHIESTLPGEQEVVVRIAYFGVQVRFQGERTRDGTSGAAVLYATVEQDALEHPETSPEMQFELFCDTQNARGLRFWEHQGYTVIGASDGKARPAQYFRMRR